MSGARLYSYRYVCGERDVVTELLTDHSARVVKHLTRVKASPLSRYASLKGRVNEEDFVNALIIAGALHDVGKAFYQRSERVTEGGCKYLTFTGHEWVSAYFIQQLRASETAWESPLANLLDITFYAVLLHHHAMDVIGRGRESPTKLRPPERDEIIEGLEELGKLIPDEAVRNAYSRNLETIVGKVLDYSRKDLAGLITTVRETYNDLLRRSAGRRGRRVLYLLGVAALVTADYLAAEEVRGPSTSRFLRAVKVFSEAYFSKPT